ncbi:MAG: hypothetical protein ACP5RZ_05990 [Thermoplasmata archaeon]
MKYFIIVIVIMIVPVISMAGNINVGINGLNGLYFNYQKIIDYIHFLPNPYGVWINDSGIYEYSNGYVKMDIVPLSSPIIFLFFNGSGESTMKFENYIYRDITFNGFQDNDSLVYARGSNVLINVWKNSANVSWNGTASMIIIINPNLDFNNNSYMLFTPNNISINVVYNGISFVFPGGGIKLNGTSVVIEKNNPILFYSNININKYYYDNVGRVLTLNETKNGYTAIINVEGNNGYNYVYPLTGMLAIIALSAIIYRVGKK